MHLPKAVSASLTEMNPNSSFGNRLERLQLDLCGRGFGDRVAASMAKGDMTKLRVLALGGAYRLTDDGLLHILRVAPNLDELHLPQCCRIQGPALEALPALTPNLRSAVTLDIPVHAIPTMSTAFYLVLGTDSHAPMGS